MTHLKQKKENIRYARKVIDFLFGLSRDPCGTTITSLNNIVFFNSTETLACCRVSGLVII